jgi:putative transposase
MAKRKSTLAELPTIWRCPDDLWEQVIRPVLDSLDPPKNTGRPRTDPRRALDGVIYHLRTGCQWNVLPKEFGDDSSVHRTYQRWVRRGVLKEVWSVLVGHCQGLGDVDYTWQSADGVMGKARKGGTVSARTPRTVRRTARNGASLWTARAAC